MMANFNSSQSCSAPIKNFNHNKSIAQNELQNQSAQNELIDYDVNENIRLLLFEHQYGETNQNYSFGETKMNNYTGLANNQSCSFATLMFGLLTCLIPTVLKGEIYKLVKSMCQSPHIATNTWQLLENDL